MHRDVKNENSCCRHQGTQGQSGSHKDNSDDRIGNHKPQEEAKRGHGRSIFSQKHHFVGVKSDAG